MRVTAWVVLVVFSGAALAAQMQGPDDPNAPNAQTKTPVAKSCVPATPEGIGSLDTVVKDLPFSGTRVFTCREILPDGTVVAGKRTIYEWRDSEGRVRRERRDRFFPKRHHDVWVDVLDPVSHVMWKWETGKDSSHQLMETKYKPAGEYLEFPMKFQFAKWVQPEGPTWKDERLHPKWLHGVYVTGDRILNVAKPGWNGNKTNHPVLEVTEDWLSVDLGVIVQHSEITADGSEDTEDLYDIDRSEPDSSLFEPPKGYQVLETKPVIEHLRFVFVPKKGKPASRGAGAVVTLSGSGTTVKKP
jgi:hypothetical protein